MLCRFVTITIILFFIASCSSTKKTSRAEKNIITVDLDSIEVVASKENPYRASAAKEFDLIHTKLEVDFNYHQQQLYGKATITLQPHFYPKQILVLDAKQFYIKEVSLVTGDNSRESLPYEYDSLQLKIQLKKSYKAGEKLTVYIDYTANPEERKAGGSAAISGDKGLYFINPLGEDSLKPIQIWTQGETESNSCWFPTIDKPNQKMTTELFINHAKKYVSLSNGVLAASNDVNDSTVIDYWKMDLPHAPYLVMMAVGDFTITRDNWRDIPVNYYTEKKYAPYARQIFGNTPEMIEFFSQKLGFDYPWPKYSQIVVRDYVSGAMENTSATLHGNFIQRDSRELLDETHEDIISHELFHHWFGDLVTAESWSNIPLNESFATYGEYLWNEYKYGKEYADCRQYENYQKYLEEAKSINVDLIRFFYNDKEDMFDRHSYEKGGLLLNYLRQIVGDKAFFKSLEWYLKKNQFKPVEIHQLRLAFEEVTGQDMNWFFNDWFLNAGHPVLQIDYGYKEDSIFVTIEQRHNTDKLLTYELPFRLDIWHGNQITTHQLTLTKKVQVFAFKVSGKPDLIDFDGGRYVLCEKTENKTEAEYVFQYRHAPLYVQRYEALSQLAKVQKQNPIATQVLHAAMNDHSPYIRQFAIDEIELPKNNTDSIFITLATLAQSDSNSAVRRSAILQLGKSVFDTLYIALFEKAVGDSSYQVVSAALKALNDVAPKKALAIAKQFEKDENADLAGSVAGVYAKEGDESYQSYFEKKLRSTGGVNKYSLFYYYANFLTRMDQAAVLTGIKTIEELGAAATNHFLTASAKGSLKRIAKIFDDKKQKADAEIDAAKNTDTKTTLQHQAESYSTISSEANQAVQRLNKKNK